MLVVQMSRQAGLQRRPHQHCEHRPDVKAVCSSPAVAWERHTFCSTTTTTWVIFCSIFFSPHQQPDALLSLFTHHHSSGAIKQPPAHHASSGWLLSHSRSRPVPAPAHFPAEPHSLHLPEPAEPCEHSRALPVRLHYSASFPLRDRCHLSAGLQ